MNPEKSLKKIKGENMAYFYEVNTIIPCLIIKNISANMSVSHPFKIVVLSARVGSISDNKLGGWYSYRASKAALNMIIKCASIEIQRVNKKAVIVGIHPGTVDSNLSKPFQSNVPKSKLFCPETSALKMAQVIQQLQPIDSGECFDYAKKIIEP